MMTVTQFLTSRDLQFHWSRGEQISEPKITASVLRAVIELHTQYSWGKKEVISCED